MPIYEYVCESCGEKLEVLQKISDPAPAKCERCNNGPMVKKVSVTSFQLKGGGWYSDGYTSKASESTTSTSDTKNSAKTKETKKTASDSK